MPHIWLLLALSSQAATRSGCSRVGRSGFDFLLRYMGVRVSFLRPTYFAGDTETVDVKNSHGEQVSQAQRCECLVLLWWPYRALLQPFCQHSAHTVMKCECRNVLGCPHRALFWHSTFHRNQVKWDSSASERDSSSSQSVMKIVLGRPHRALHEPSTLDTYSSRSNWPNEMHLSSVDRLVHEELNFIGRQVCGGIGFELVHEETDFIWRQVCRGAGFELVHEALDFICREICRRVGLAMVQNELINVKFLALC